MNKILWVDLEMTGLDPAKDKIIEVGAIITDWNFKEIDQFEQAIKVDEQIIKKRMLVGPNSNFWNSVPKARDGLIKQSKEIGKSSKKVESELILFVNKHFTKNIPVLLAGNSIHQDRKFIDNEWPNLAKLLHYRMLDVSAWKVVFEAKSKKKFAKKEEHRALDDIKGSIEELKYYLKRVKL